MYVSWHILSGGFLYTTVAYAMLEVARVHKKFQRLLIIVLAAKYF